MKSKSHNQSQYGEDAITILSTNHSLERMSSQPISAEKGHVFTGHSGRVEFFLDSPSSLFLSPISRQVKYHRYKPYHIKEIGLNLN
jgi:hypothetical protein